MPAEFALTQTTSGHQRLEYPASTHIDLDLAKRSVQAVSAAVDGSYRLAVLLSGLRHLETDARSYLADLDGPIAVAVVVTSPVDRIVGNTFMSLGNLKYPMRIFSDESEADSWLSQQS